MEKTLEADAAAQKLSADAVDMNAVIDADAKVADGANVKAELDGANANQADQQTETKTETKTEPEKRESVISKIKNIIRRKVDDGTGQNADTSANTNADTGTAGTDIPAEFADAATKAGMTISQIQDFSSDYTNEELIKQIPYLLAQVSENSDKSEQLSQKETGDAQQVAEKKVEEKSGETDAKDAEIKSLRERLDKVEASQQENSKQSEQDKLISMASRATKRMDELSTEFEVFGIYDKLPRWPHNNKIIPNSPAAIARNEVWGLAYDLTTKAGIAFDSALDISVNAYKGKNLVKDVERNLVRGLKASERKLSAKHTSHESAKTNLTGPDVIREIGKKHGVEIR